MYSIIACAAVFAVISLSGFSTVYLVAVSMIISRYLNPVFVSCRDTASIAMFSKTPYVDVVYLFGHVTKFPVAQFDTRIAFLYECRNVSSH